MFLAKTLWRVAAIAPWFHLRLSSPAPGSNLKHTIYAFFQFVLLKLYPENNKNKQKEAGIGPFKKKTFWKCSILLSNAFKLIHNDYVSLI